MAPKKAAVTAPAPVVTTPPPQSTPPAPVAAVAPVVVSGIQISMGLPPAPSERAFGAGAAPSPYAEAMKGMPAPVLDAAGNATSVASFFVAGDEVPAAITDATERATAEKEAARKASNRLSGIARRITKADADMAFALRTVTEGGKLGVRVYRVKPEPEAPAGAAQ